VRREEALYTLAKVAVRLLATVEGQKRALTGDLIAASKAVRHLADGPLFVDPRGPEPQALIEALEFERRLREGPHDPP
jgi:hypothetical protein